MPAPTRTLTVADVHRFVDEQVFRNAPPGEHEGRKVGVELEWIAVARDGAACTPEALARPASLRFPDTAGSRSSPAGNWS